MHDGNCYTNGSYVFDSDIYGYSNSIMCVLPNSTLNGGEWVAPNGSSIDCSTDPLHCNFISSPANISLYILTGQNIPLSNEGWYKCCLPTNCSDPNSDIIFANIYSECSHCSSCTHYHFTVEWAQIENLTVDLSSDITALPQNYTLHAIKIGLNDHKSFLLAANWYYVFGNTGTQICGGNKYSTYSCTIGNGTAVNYGNGRWYFTLTVIWNEENITSGALSQSNNNGDQVYRFSLRFGLYNNFVTRNRYISVTGH